MGAAKVTGTGAGGDLWLLADAGAFPVYDFTHAGLATTCRAEPERVFQVFAELQDHLTADGCELELLEDPEHARALHARLRGDRRAAPLTAPAPWPRHARAAQL